MDQSPRRIRRHFPSPPSSFKPKADPTALLNRGTGTHGDTRAPVSNKSQPAAGHPEKTPCAQQYCKPPCARSETSPLPAGAWPLTPLSFQILLPLLLPASFSAQVTFSTSAAAQPQAMRAEQTHKEYVGMQGKNRKWFPQVSARIIKVFQDGGAHQAQGLRAASMRTDAHAGL